MDLDQLRELQDNAVWSESDFELIRNLSRQLNSSGVGGQYDMSQYGEYRVSTHIWRYVAPLTLAVGTLGSVLSLLVLCRRSMRSQTTMFYLAALAIADLMVLYAGLVRLWLEHAENIYFRLMSATACRLHNFFVYLSLDLSVWILVAVSVDRCLYVSWPASARRWCTLANARVVVSAILCLSALVNMHFFWTYDVESSDTHQIYANGQRKCYADTASSLTVSFVENIWPWIDFCVYCLCPFFFMATCNAIIIKQLVRTDRNMAIYHKIVLDERRRVNSEEGHDQRTKSPLKMTSSRGWGQRSRQASDNTTTTDEQHNNLSQDDSLELRDTQHHRQVASVLVSHGDDRLTIHARDAPLSHIDDRLTIHARDAPVSHVDVRQVDLDIHQSSHNFSSKYVDSNMTVPVVSIRDQGHQSTRAESTSVGEESNHELCSLGPDTIITERCPPADRLDTAAVDRCPTADRLDTAAVDRCPTADRLDIAAVDRCPTSDRLDTTAVDRCPTSDRLDAASVDRCPTSARLDAAAVDRCPPSDRLDIAAVDRCPTYDRLDIAAVDRCPTSARLDTAAVDRCPPCDRLDIAAVDRCPTSDRLDIAAVDRCPTSARLDTAAVDRCPTSARLDAASVDKCPPAERSRSAVNLESVQRQNAAASRRASQTRWSTLRANLTGTENPASAHVELCQMDVGLLETILSPQDHPMNNVRGEGAGSHSSESDTRSDNMLSSAKDKKTRSTSTVSELCTSLWPAQTTASLWRGHKTNIEPHALNDTTSQRHTHIMYDNSVNISENPRFDRSPSCVSCLKDYNAAPAGDVWVCHHRGSSQAGSELVLGSSHMSSYSSKVSSTPSKVSSTPSKVSSTPSKLTSSKVSSTSSKVSSTPSKLTSSNVSSTPSKVSSTPSKLTSSKVSSTPSKVSSTPSKLTPSKVSSTPSKLTSSKVSSTPSKVSSTPSKVPSNTNRRVTALSTERQISSSSSRRSTSSVSKTLLAVTIMFWLFNAPIVIFIIGHTYFAASADGRGRAMIILIWTLVNILQYLNNALHFFLYCLTGPKFRQELRDMFKEWISVVKRWSWRRSED